MKVKRFLIAAGLFIFMNALVLLFANGKPSHTIGFFLQILGYSSVVNPMTFLVSHITYFGGVIFLILLFFRSFITKLNSLGVGFELVVFFYLFLLIDPESRQLVPMIPFLVIGVVSILKKEISFKWCVLLFALNIFISKIWYIMGFKEVVENGFQEFPFQHYFMNQGPWMSTPMYYVHLTVYVLMGLLIFWYLKRTEEKILVSN